MLSELEVRAQLLEIKGKNAEAKQGTKINIITMTRTLYKVQWVGRSGFLKLGLYKVRIEVFPEPA